MDYPVLKKSSSMATCAVYCILFFPTGKDKPDIYHLYLIADTDSNSSRSAGEDVDRIV